jgi:hypothetical protein
VNELLTLFVADLNRAIDGLKQSIGLGPEGMTQASLHARDLSDALHSVSLPRHAEIALVISRHLSAGRPGMEDFTQQLLGLVEEAIGAMSESQAEQQFPNQEQAIVTLARAVSLFGEQPADFNSLAFQTSSDTSRTSAPAAATPTPMVSDSESPSGVIDLEEVTGLMYFAGQEPVSPLARIPISSELSGPEMSSAPRMTLHDRLFALKTIQALDHEINRSASEPLAHTARQRLTDHANWLMSLAQEPLRKRLVGMARTLEVSGVSADADVIDYLISAMSVLPQPSSIRASSQHQTLVVDLAEIRPDPDAMDRASRIVQILAGRIDQTVDGLRLVLPSSLSRLRVVPFTRDGVVYALSWSQFLKAETVKPTDSDAPDLLGPVQTTRLCLSIKSGTEPMSIYADEIRPFEIANAFLLPPAVEAPEWVAGVLVGSTSEPVIWVVPASS